MGRVKIAEESESANLKPSALLPGGIWLGTRTYQKGAWQGATLTYELHVRTVNEGKFEGHVFDNGTGRNRAEVAGELRGEVITWKESPIGGGKIAVEGTISGEEIKLKFTRTHDNGGSSRR